MLRHRCANIHPTAPQFVRLPGLYGILHVRLPGTLPSTTKPPRIRGGIVTGGSGGIFDGVMPQSGLTPGECSDTGALTYFQRYSNLCVSLGFTAFSTSASRVRLPSTTKPPRIRGGIVVGGSGGIRPRQRLCCVPNGTCNRRPLRALLAPACIDVPPARCLLRRPPLADRSVRIP